MKPGLVDQLKARIEMPEPSKQCEDDEMKTAVLWLSACIAYASITQWVSLEPHTCSGYEFNAECDQKRMYKGIRATQGVDLVEFCRSNEACSKQCDLKDRLHARAMVRWAMLYSMNKALNVVAAVRDYPERADFHPGDTAHRNAHMHHSIRHGLGEPGQRVETWMA